MGEKSGEYWRERFRQLEEAQNDTSVQTMREIEQQFRRAERALNAKINAWYGRFAVNNEISMTEARRLLNSDELEEFRWDVNEYIKHGRENAKDERWIKELENASAKVHISRLEALKVQTQQEMEKLFGNYSDAVDKHITGIYTSSYYHTAFEVQRGIGIGWDMQKLNAEKVNDIIHKPWAVDGRNFSERIWTSKTKLINSLHNSLTRMCITGESPERIISEFAKSMDASRSQAANIIQTESAAFSAKAQESCYADLDVEEFEVVETLDNRTCSVCGDMDGKHFPMKDYQIGVTVPPFHPRCRGCTCPYFDDEFTVNEKRAARKEDGKTYYVPADMTYKEWKSAFVDGEDETELEELKAESKSMTRMPKHRGKPGARAQKNAESVETGILYELEGMSEKGQKRVKECYDELSSRYNSPLKEVGRLSSGKGGRGKTDVTGERIELANTSYHTIIHEFFHSLAATSRDKLGLSDNQAFWKKIKAIRKEYMNAVSDDIGKSISIYSRESVDEFAAEAFAQYTSILKGIKLDDGIGADTTYSKQVVECIDKYFRKSSIEDALENTVESVKLSVSEELALNKYVSFDSYLINDTLRTNGYSALSDAQKEIVDNIDSALKKMPTYSGNLVRDIDFSDFPNRQELLDEFWEEFIVDDEIQFDEYISTTTNLTYADNPSVRIYIQNSAHGRNIRNLNPKEQEVLYERNSRFKVITKMINPDDGIYYILLEEA